MDKSLEEKQPYTAASLGAEAGVSGAYIARLCREGKIPAMKLNPQLWLIQYEVGQDWIKKREAKLES